MDDKISPCDDFYQFACGQYIARSNIPEGKDYVDTFSTIEELAETQKSQILSEPPEPNELRTFVLAKHLYTACVNNRFIHLDALRESMRPYGGWPVVVGDDWNQIAYIWDWKETIKKMRSYGSDTNTIFTMDIESNTGSRSIRVSTVTEPGKEV